MSTTVTNLVEKSHIRSCVMINVKQLTV